MTPGQKAALTKKNRRQFFGEYLYADVAASIAKKMDIESICIDCEVSPRTVVTVKGHITRGTYFPFICCSGKGLCKY